MTISFSQGFFNGDTTGGFDDPWQRRQHLVQQALGQHAPRTPDGGRTVLWRCSRCLLPWRENTASHCSTQLSPQQLLASLEGLGIVGGMESLPEALCPHCSTHLIGGTIRTEEALCGQGFRFIWRCADGSEVWTYQMWFPDEAALSQFEEEADLISLLDATLSQPMDLWLPSAELRPLLKQLEQLPEPQWDELLPFSIQQLARQAQLIPLLPPGHLRGYFWFPTLHLETFKEFFFVAASCVVPALTPPSPTHLFEAWKTLFHNFIHSLPA